VVLRVDDSNCVAVLAGCGGSTPAHIVTNDQLNTRLGLPSSPEVIDTVGVVTAA